MDVACRKTIIIQRFLSVTVFKGVIKNSTKHLNWSFCENSERLLAFNYFLKRLHLSRLPLTILTARKPVYLRTEAYSKPCQTSKIECFAKIVDRLKPLIILAKHYLRCLVFRIRLWCMKHCGFKSKLKIA